MCWTCDHPEASHEEWLDHARSRIPDGGWTVLPVGGTRTDAPFA